MYWPLTCCRSGLTEMIATSAWLRLAWLVGFSKGWLRSDPVLSGDVLCHALAMADTKMIKTRVGSFSAQRTPD